MGLLEVILAAPERVYGQPGWGQGDNPRRNRAGAQDRSGNDERDQGYNWLDLSELKTQLRTT